MLKLFTSKHEDCNWVKVSELRKAIEDHEETGKTNVFLVGANLIADETLMLPSDKYHVVIYHCRFKKEKTNAKIFRKIYG